MSRRFVGNRGDLLSALGAASTTGRTSARRVRGLVQRDEGARCNRVLEEAAAAPATAVAPMRKRQRLETGSRTGSRTATATTRTNTRPMMMMMTTTTRKSRDLRFSTRSYATEHTPPLHRRDAGPKSARKTRRYDPGIELKDYTGSRAHPEIQAVLKGRISLETARVLRLQNLMALLNNVDQVTRQLRDEDMAGDPAALEARMAAFLTAREQTVEMWRQAARARQQQQQRYSVNDPDTAMVHPAHVPGRRMGPAESEQQCRELDRLVQEQTATFEVRPLPVRQRRTVAGAATATITSASFGAVQQQQQQQQQQTRLFSTWCRTPALAIRPVRRSFFSTTSTSAFQSSSSRAKTTTATTTDPKPNSSTTQTVPNPKSRSSPSPSPSPRSTTKSTSRSRSTPLPPPPRSNAKPDNNRPPTWLVQKRALAAKFGSGGWSPRRKLSPDAMLHLRALHAANPQLYTTPLLASTFKQSPEAIRRILKSKWLGEASADKVQARRERWARRHDRIWDVKSELGLRPKRKGDRKVEDANVAGERVESEMWAEEVLSKAREGGGI